MKTRLGQKLFAFLRNLLALFGLLCLVGGGIGAWYAIRSFNLPPRVLAEKILERTGLEDSALASMVAQNPIRPANIQLPPLDAVDWAGHGARRDAQLGPVVYNQHGAPVPLAWVEDNTAVLGETPAPGRIVRIDDARSFLQAMREAEPGDVITLAPGTYRLDRRTISLSRPGTRQGPIMVRAERLGDATLEMNTLEGFLVNAPYWIFENLDIKGVCTSDNSCEHAFHVVGQGRGFVLRNSRLREFNAMIKANGLGPEDQRVFPDRALIENNTFFNSRIRDTRSPVVFLDIVGTDDWIIRGNMIADFAKGRGDQISTGAFIKGNAARGVFENNLVICEYAHSGGTRLGLSFGGGGSSKQASRHQDNSIEHTSGIARNNIVMFCPDVGLYLNKAQDSQVLNNIFFRTMGIDVRFSESTALIANNLLDGKVRDRDGGFSIRENNLVLKGGFLGKDFEDIFQNPLMVDFTVTNGAILAGKALPSEKVTRDFCDRPRPSAPSIGAIEVQAEGECLPIRIQEKAD